MLEVDVAGPTLHCLKAMLDPAAGVGSTDPDSKYSRLIHGLLSSCLSHVDEMRSVLQFAFITVEPSDLPLSMLYRHRQGAVATMKVKNNLLAAVLILTVIPPPPAMKLSRAAIDYCCTLISQQLSDPDSPEVCLTLSLLCMCL